MTSPLDSPSRLRALRETGLLDAPREEAYDRLTRLACRLVGAPVALLTVVGPDRQRFVSETGLGAVLDGDRETPLSHSFCQHVVARHAPLVVEDAPRHPLVDQSAAIEDLGVQAYLGVPFRAPEGEILGALCVIDHGPRVWSVEDLAALADFAEVAAAEVAARVVGQRSAAHLREAALRIEDHETLTALLFHRSAVPMALVAEDGLRVRLANAAFEHQVGRPAGQVVGLSLLDVAAQDPEAVRPALEAMFEVPTVFDSSHQTPDAFVHEVRLTTQPVAVAGQPYVLVSVEDQTERHETEAHLHEREALLALAVDAAGFGLWSADLVTGAGFWDARCREILGVGPDVPASGVLRASVVHPDDRARAAEVFEAALADPDGPFRVEVRVGDGGGAPRWVLAVGQVMHDDDGAPARILGLAADVTERKVAEAALRDRSAWLEREVAERTEALRRRSEQARGLASALALAEQRERRRIAHVLHEDLQQILYGAGLHLEADRMAGHPPPADGAVGSLVERALALTRSLAQELAAPGVADGRLDRALTWLASTVTDTHGLAVDVAAEPVTVDAEVCDVCVQLVRELLFNVVKHAKTDRAVLRVRGDGAGAVVTVEDDGAGFDPAETASRSQKGVGLRGVRDRTGLLGGRVEVEAAVGHGTRVTLRVPAEVGVPPIAAEASG